MEQKTLKSQLLCGIPPTEQSGLPLEDLAARIKQEVTDDYCVPNPEHFSDTRQDCSGNFGASLTKVECTDGQERSATSSSDLTFSDDEGRGMVSTDTPLIKPVKHKAHYESESRSVCSGPRGVSLPIEMKQEEEFKLGVDDHVLYKFEPGLDKQDDDVECREHAQLREDTSPFVDTCNVKVERDTDLVRQTGSKCSSEVEVFVCFRCNYLATEKDCLRRHMRRYHSDNVQKRSDTEGQKIRSGDTKTQRRISGNRYRCKQCDFTTKLRYYLTTHVTIKHSSDAPVYRCEKCSYTTKWKQSLSTHINGLHPGHSEIYKCPYCDYPTNSKETLSRHLRVQHDPNAKLYKCSVCRFTTKHASSLAIHATLRHESDAPVYQCAECSFSTKRKYNLLAHFKALHDTHAESYKCPHCRFATRHKYNLSKHMNAWHDPSRKPYKHKCPHCRFATKHKHNLSKHMNVQHDPSRELYKCAVCNFATKSAAYLSKHERVKHSPDTPVHRCTECNYTSKWKHCLRHHIKVRHVELYKCSRCDYTAKREDALLEHSKLSHNPEVNTFECTECGYVTDWRLGLIQHKTAEHGANAEIQQVVEHSYSKKHEENGHRVYKKKVSK